MSGILITGSTGFIGKSLVNNLLGENKKIFAIIRKNKKNIKSTEKIKKKYKNFFPIFFKNNKELKKKLSKIKFNAVVNLATNYMPYYTHKDLSSIMNSNIIFPTLILDLCCKFKTLKFINLCSIMQFDKNRHEIPQNFYSLTKILFKQTMSYYQIINKNKIFINLYIGDTYGSNDNRKKILPTLLKNYKKNKNTKILTKNLELNVLHVEDVIRGIKILIKKKIKSNNFHIKSKNKINLYNMVKKFNKNYKKKLKVIWMNKMVAKVNKVKMQNIPGWKEKFNVINSFYKDLYESN